MFKIFVAAIEVQHPYGDDDHYLFKARFASSKAAEAAIADQQAKIAPEPDWTSLPDGSSVLSGEYSKTVAMVWAEEVYESAEEEYAYSARRLADLRARLGV